MAVSAVILFVYMRTMSVSCIITAILLVIYGARLGGYLLYREVKSKAYNSKMKAEIKSGKGMSFL